MTLRQIIIQPEDSSLVVGADNRFGIPLTIQIPTEDLGAAGLEAVATLRQVVRGLLPADPPARFFTSASDPISRPVMVRNPIRSTEGPGRRNRC